MSGENAAVDRLQAHESLAEALLAAQKEMPAVEPDKSNPGFKGSKFVSLGNLLAKVRPVLNRNGLVLMQAPKLSDGAFVLETTLLHSSGESFVFETPLNPTKNDPQGQGSAITYMRRYTVAAALAIADQEDDDGNAGSKAVEYAPVARLRPERVASIIEVFKDRHLNGTAINAHLAAAEVLPLRRFTAEATSDHIASLGELEADRLEAELAKGRDAERLPDDTLDQLLKGYEIAGPELGGLNPLDGLNVLLGSLGFDALEVGAEGGVRAQMAFWSPEQAEAVNAEFEKAADDTAEEVDGEVVDPDKAADAEFEGQWKEAKSDADA